MESSTWAIVIGGIGAALCFGIGGALQKTANQEGAIALGPYLLVVGLSVMVVGGVALLIDGGRSWSWGSVASSSSFAVLWGLGTAAVAIAISRFGGQVSTLVPLYNTNTLVAVVIGLLVFKEWQSINLWLLLPGAMMIVVGGVLAARA